MHINNFSLNTCVKCFTCTYYILANGGSRISFCTDRALALTKIVIQSIVITETKWHVAIKGTPMWSGRETNLKWKFSKTYCILVTNVFSVSKRILCTFICLLSIWQLGLKLECICWAGKCVTNDFPRSTKNKLPTIKRHITVLQDRLQCPRHVDKKIKQVFENFLFKCVTRPDFSGVPLTFIVFIIHVHLFVWSGWQHVFLYFLIYNVFLIMAA